MKLTWTKMSSESNKLYCYSLRRRQRQRHLSFRSAYRERNRNEIDKSWNWQNFISFFLNCCTS